MRKNITKSVTVFALVTSLVTSSLVSTSGFKPVNAQATMNTESILAKLTPEQRKALTQLKLSDQSGLQLSPDVNLNSDEKISVIVQFKTLPSKTAVMSAQAEGKSLSLSQANQQVEEAHTSFQNDLTKIFKDKKHYVLKQMYKHAFNGVSMQIPANKVEALMKSKAVQTVWESKVLSVDPPVEQESTETGSNLPQGDVNPFLGVNKLHEEGYTGKGIKVGVIDTGIDYNHPDLKAAYKGGYDFVDNDSDPMEATYDDWKKSKQLEFVGGASYYTSHGTHVSGTIAGQGTNDSEYSVRGVAPDADLYVYRVLGPYGRGSFDAIIGGIDRAVSEGMDVINLSLGSDYNDPMNPIAFAINNAVLSGVTAVLAAGNAGNGMYTVGTPGNAPLGLAVGASSVPTTIAEIKGSVQAGTEKIASDIRLIGKSYTDQLQNFIGKNLPVENVGFGTFADYNGKDVKGKIALVQRGNITLNDKIKFAKLKGAAALFIYNNDPKEGYVPNYIGDSIANIPTFSLTNAQGLALIQKLQAGATTYSFEQLGQVKTEGDKLANFSSRGPARVTYDIKPEVTAPGVDILSTVPTHFAGSQGLGDYKHAYTRLSGTSMASPHVAGIAALMLQAHPDYTPLDVKTTFMNTADSLKDNYSVFEVGAGRVDAYEAIHADGNLEVLDKTDIMIGSKMKTIKEKTGAISFGTFASTGVNIGDHRNVVLKNNSKESKVFDIKVEYQAARGSNDAVANNVKITVDSELKVKAGQEKNHTVFIDIPANAEKGAYEGYIVYTNKQNPDETYQIPFAARFVEEGIEEVGAYPYALTSNTFDNHPFTRPRTDLFFQLKSHMRYIDVVLADATTNEDLGIIGTIDGIAANENILYRLANGFGGIYIPFSADPNSPLVYKYEQAKPGLYKIKLIGRSDEEKTFSAETKVYIEDKNPTVQHSLPFGVYEYEEGQQSIPFSGTIFDKDIEDMKTFGFDMDQSYNSVVGYYDSYMGPYGWKAEPSETLEVDQNGKYKGEAKLNPNSFTRYYSFAMDAASNGDFGRMNETLFVKKGSPYISGSLNKEEIKMGETVSTTLTAHNLNKTNKVTFEFDYAQSNFEIVEISGNSQSKNQISSITKEETNGISGKHVKVTVETTNPISGALPLLDIQVKAKSENYNKGWYELQDLKATYINQSGQAEVAPGFMKSFKVLPTYSQMAAKLLPEGLFTPQGMPIAGMDYSKIGAEIKVIDDQMNEYTSVIAHPNGFFEVLNLPLSDKPFTVEMAVPSHFTTKAIFTIGKQTENGVLGEAKLIGGISIIAGDVNNDNVIDVMDAINMKENWGTNNRNTDINFDGTTDAKDFAFVEANYLMSNPTVNDAPKAVKKYNGTMIDDVKIELGIN
ncbi:S8 family serine peptidase [Neobacillus niacini]|uniref:S8 family serine peptidase n=1 Tax=Neobacillus niacini TaxID=86668 RepID=UPI0005EFAA44|nr:S8 family serine peptidase [Neobacillus niacini]